MELSGSSDSLTVINHAIRLQELNTLEWDELLINDPSNSILPVEGNRLDALFGNISVSIAWKSI